MPSRRCGFTLLEVLLVILLSTLLVAAVWSLLGVYIGLFEKGENRTEHAQLVRALMRQISDDLHATIQDVAPRTAETPATAPLRRFGLFGTAESLQIDILRVAPSDASYMPKEEVTLATPEVAPAGPKAPEFRTVKYQFVAASEDSEEEVESGLTRRELDWEIPGVDQANGDLAGSTTSGSAALSGGSSSRDDGKLYVPEVVSLEFRYFDGQGWTSQWNSIERKSLPAAIEVRMQIEPPESPSERRLRDVQGRESRDEPRRDRQDEGDQPRIQVHEAAEQEKPKAERNLPTQRMVIYLAASPLQKPSVATADSSLLSIPVLAVPAAPMPMVPPPSLDFPAAPLPVSPEDRPRGPGASGDLHLRSSGGGL